MLVSVIIPSFRPGDYLYQCLLSLKEQTFSNECFEVILILNGCREPYESRIREFINTSLSEMNVEFICIDKGGVSNARNIGLDNARGEYIAFIDDDDYVSATYLEELYSASSNNTVGLSNAIAFDDITGRYDESYSISKAYLKCINQKGGASLLQARKYFSGPCMKLIHHNIIGNRRFDCRYSNGEDSLFMFLISDKVQRVRLTSKRALYYRRYRVNSAVTSSKTTYSKLKNCSGLIVDYSSIYALHPIKYNFIFYVTRIIASIHSLFSNK